MDSVIVVLFFIIGFVVWVYKKENLPLYCIYLTTFGLLFLEFSGPSYTNKDLLDTYAIIQYVFSILLMFCTAINFIQNPQKKAFFDDTYKFWIYMFFGGVYFLLWQSIHGRTSGGGITRTFLFASLLPVFYRSLPYKINVEKYKKHIVAICIVESLFVIFNLFFGPIYLSQILDSDHFFVSGSFYRYNALASMIAMVGIVLSFSFFYKNLRATHYVCLMAAVFACILMTGARMQLVWIVVTMFLIAFSNFKANKKLCVAMLFLSVFAFLFVKSIDLHGYSTWDAQSGLERQFYGIVSAVNRNSVESGEQTQDASLYMIENYFHKSPLIGNALGYKEYSYHPAIPTELMMGDAAFAFLLVEYGFLGLFFALLIIYSAFQIMKKGMSPINRKKANVLFASLFVITITESGLFDYVLMMYVWTYMAWMKYRQPPYLSIKNNNDKQ